MSSPTRWRGLGLRRKRSNLLMLEDLEGRVVLSMLLPIQWHDPNPQPPALSHAKPTSGSKPLDFGSPTPVGYTPAQIRAAYGIDNVTFGTITGDGARQTIAIVDAYDDPAFVDSSINGSPNPAFSSSDLAQFDEAFGLADPPSFTKYNETGETTNLPGTDPAGAGNLDGNWEMEEALDIEWAHAIAPAASIGLVEASNDTNNADMFTAVATAANLPGVSVVSMSWGIDEYDGQQAVDSTFTTPSGHQGVTFVAASGDQGSPGYYPAYSPNVLAAGGTTLTLNSDNTIQSETAWSGSGGGTSQYEPEPAYQEGFQDTGQRTIPDVAWDADPNTGVAEYDSYDDTDGSGPWIEIGGTSVAAPSWSGLIAIANQGRAREDIGSLNGLTQTLPAIYYAPAADFNDITKGSNGGFSAGPGYDEVTGRGTPKADLLIPELVSFGAASKIVVTAQPPGQIIVGDSFGVVVSAEDAAGQVDPAFEGSVTIAMGNDPTGATLGGTLTVTASHGEAVFDGLNLNSLGTGYTLTIGTTKFASVTTAPFAIITNPTPGSGTFYPVPTDASLRQAIETADSNGDASNTIVLTATTYVLTDTTAGQIVIQNSSQLAGKTLTIVGQKDTAAGTIIEPGTSPWQDRIFEVLATSGSDISVVFQDLAISGGNATNGGILGGDAALGGGLLIDGGTVSMTRVTVMGDEAKGTEGAAGAKGGKGQAPGDGGAGKPGRGGGIYLADGTLMLKGSTFSHDLALGGAGGSGGAAAHTAGQTKVSAGGKGGTGASASGGGLYVAGGTVEGSGDSFTSNAAVGGEGGIGGPGGIGGASGGGGAGGPGGIGGAAGGGGIYLEQGSITLGGGQIRGNSAIGGAGGRGGTGGAGSSLVATSNISLSGISQTPSGGVGFPTGTSILNGTGLSKLFHGGPGGAGGAGGSGGAGTGGGVYVAGGSLTISTATLGGNQAVGGQGGTGGRGGQAGMAALLGGMGSGMGSGLGSSPGLGSGLGSGSEGGGGGAVPLGGRGGLGGDGGSGSGGGLYLAAGTVTFLDDTFSGNAARGGAGGTGGTGGAGGFAGGLSGLGGITGIGSGSGSAGGSGPGLTLGGSRHHAKHQTSAGGSTNVGGFATGGSGGDAGNGGQAFGGSLYITGGSLSMEQDTVAANSVVGGKGGSGGLGGKGGSYGMGNGQPGQAGQAGAGSAGALYLHSGTISVFNSTIALNTQSGGGSVGGVLQVGGSVKAVSTLFAGNGAVDYSGTLDATDSLIQAPAMTASITGSGNLTNVDPKLAAAGLADNGGPTQTIALQANSPAIGTGSNPENFATDQRGYGPRTGPGGTDIGAVQHNAGSEATDPTAALNADAVTSTAAANPYTFTVTFTDEVAIEASTLPGAIVQVIPPGGAAAITASKVSVAAVGPTDPSGDAPSFVVTYEITPPGSSWSAADNGTYTVTLGGSPVTNLAGIAVATGTLGSFNVQIPAASQLVISAAPSSSRPVPAGSDFTVTVAVENSQGQVQTGYSGTVNIALEVGPAGASLGGKLTVAVKQGVATFSTLTLDHAGSGYVLQATSAGVPAVTTGAFDVTAAAASQLVVTAQPPTRVTAGLPFGLAVAVEDPYHNVVTDYTGSVKVVLSTDPGNAKLGGTLTVSVSQGVATFSDLTIDKVNVGYRLQAGASGLTAAITDPFNVVAPTGGQTSTNAPSKMVIDVEPSGSSFVAAGSAFTVSVALENDQGQVQTGYSGTVTIALASDPAGATLGGTLTVQVSQGVATFSNLSLSQPGQGYTLLVTSSGLPSITTADFNVVAATVNPPSSSGDGGSQPGGGQSNNPTTGSSSTTSEGSSTTGSTSTGSTGKGSKKSDKKETHKPQKKAHEAKGHQHKPPSRRPAHDAKPKSHHTKTAIPHLPRGIRSHPLLRRRFS